MNTDSIAARIDAIMRHLRTGQPRDALDAARALARDAPGDARAHALQARAASAQGRTEEAERAVAQALALNPEFVPALVEAAQLARRAGAHARCVELLRHLLKLGWRQPGVHYDLGVSLLELGREPEAERELRCALELAPQLLEARFKLAGIAHRHGNRGAALEGYEACCAARPDWFEAWLNRGMVLFELERAREAAQAYRRTTELRPASVEAWTGYGRSLTASNGRADDLIVAALRVVELLPESADAWHRLAVAYRYGEFYPEFAQACDRALALNPNLLLARWDRFQLPDAIVRGDAAQDEAFLQRWEAGLEYFERLDPAEPDAMEQLTSVAALQTNYHLHYLGQPFVQLQRRYAHVIERLAHAQCPPPPLPERARSERCRIGFVSGFFRYHIVTKTFRRLIEGLPRDRFEVTLFHVDDRSDHVTEEMLASAEHSERGTRNAREWPALIAAHALDVLVFVDIGLHPTPSYLASYRYAPLQLALWGHPVTTGSRHIDYYLSADAMEPPDAERNYSERLVRLPRVGTCYGYPTLEPDRRVEVPARSEPGTVHYLLAQNVVKLTPIHDRLLARIAQELPQARFSLTPHWQSYVRDQLSARMRLCFAAHGLDFERHVYVHPWLEEAQFLGLAAESDVNLDSLGFSGGVTTLEITRLDVPTVTLPGGVMRSRQSYGMLRLMGMDELVARDPDDYVRIAVGLGRDPSLRARLRERIAGRKHVLFDDHGVIEAFADWLLREHAARA